MSYESGVKFADMNFEKEKGSDPDIVKDQTSKSDQKDTECNSEDKHGEHILVSDLKQKITRSYTYLFLGNHIHYKAFDCSRHSIMSFQFYFYTNFLIT
jgi:hypothetical protein